MLHLALAMQAKQRTWKQFTAARATHTYCPHGAMVLSTMLGLCPLARAQLFKGLGPRAATTFEPWEPCIQVCVHLL